LEDKRKNNGGYRPNAGRKSLVEEKSIKDLISPYLNDAVKTVVEIMVDETAKSADRISASKLLLAYGFGNPKSEVDINNNITTDVPIEQWLNSSK
jgi:hypothetical protein